MHLHVLLSASLQRGKWIKQLCLWAINLLLKMTSAKFGYFHILVATRFTSYIWVGYNSKQYCSIKLIRDTVQDHLTRYASLYSKQMTQQQRFL